MNEEIRQHFLGLCTKPQTALSTGQVAHAYHVRNISTNSAVCTVDLHFTWAHTQLSPNQTGMHRRAVAIVVITVSPGQQRVAC